MQKNTVMKQGDVTIRILTVQDNEVLIVSSDSKALPHWVDAASLNGFISVEETLSYDDLSAAGRETAHRRFTLIAPVLGCLDVPKRRSGVIARVAEENSISVQTVKEYVRLWCLYGLAGLAPKERIYERELTQCEKDIRWALNHYYYSWEKFSLQDVYTFMLRDRYCDDTGALQEPHPTFWQFRYYFRKHNKLSNQIISREGVKEYQKNHRPLLGEGVHDFCPMPGYAMLDATVCDIYLVNEGGRLIGRPTVYTCVDGFTGLVMGYCILLEGGVYGLRKLLLNVVTDKVLWCREHGIVIQKEEWPCTALPGVLITDRGAEFISETFSQITELGVTIKTVESFRGDQKSTCEKTFDLIQELYKRELKSKGVIEPDFAERGAHDYRKDACLTMESFERIVIRAIVYLNNHRVLEHFPYTDEMIKDQVRPTPLCVWNYCTKKEANLITVTQCDVLLSLLPRCRAVFTRKGLMVNRLRYRATGFTQDYLEGGEETCAYNPDDVRTVWLIRDGRYTPFELIDKRYEDKTLGEIDCAKKEIKTLVDAEKQKSLQAQIILSKHIGDITALQEKRMDTKIKDVRKTREREKLLRHDSFSQLLATQRNGGDQV